jgi:predicted nuclease of restriction endonuclease-like (RecB) superfamily
MGKIILKAQEEQAVMKEEYSLFLKDLKAKVKSAQLKAAVKVNIELVNLYWDIGRSIHLKQQALGWGAKAVETLSIDLRREFPDMKGFSSRNLKYMLKFARAYPDPEIVHQLGAQIPWKHNILLLERVKDEKARTWYIIDILSSLKEEDSRFLRLKLGHPCSEVPVS